VDTDKERLKVFGSILSYSAEGVRPPYSRRLTLRSDDSAQVVPD